MAKLANVHPGEVLLKEFLEPMGISRARLSREIGVSPRRVNLLILGKRAINSDTALRLARYFGTSEGFWLGLQVDFDLEEARTALADRLDREVTVVVNTIPEEPEKTPAAAHPNLQEPCE